MKIAALQSTATVHSGNVTEGRVILTQRRLLFQPSWQRMQLGSPGFSEESEWSLSGPSFLRLPMQPAGSAPPPGVTQHQPVGGGESGSKYWTTTTASQALSQGRPHTFTSFAPQNSVTHKLWWSEPLRGAGGAHGLNNSPLVTQEGSGGLWVWTRKSVS